MKFVNLMQPSPIKLDHYDPRMEEFWESDTWDMEFIEDGKRIQCKIEDGKIAFSLKKEEGRLIEDLDQKIPYIYEDLRKINCENILLDGFLYGSNFSSTVKILDNDVEKSTELQKQNGKIKFCVHDLIVLNNEEFFNYSYSQRRNKLEELTLENSISIARLERKEKHKKYFEEKNHNGVFFKNFESPYFFKKDSLWKYFFQKDTFYGVVLDIAEGVGKLERMAGSIIIGQTVQGQMTQLCGISNGINYDLRMNMFDEKEKYLNKVVEFRAVKTENSYRDTRFKKFIDEMKPEQCIF